MAVSPSQENEAILTCLPRPPAFKEIKHSVWLIYYLLMEKGILAILGVFLHADLLPDTLQDVPINYNIASETV